RFVAPVLALGLMGAASIPFPQLLANGRDLADLAFTGQVAPLLLLALLLLRPAATLLFLTRRTPGGVFTPSLALGRVPGGALRAAGWRPRICVVAALARGAARIVRRAWRRGCRGRHHPGTGLDRRPPGRADRTWPVVHSAPALGGDDRHAHGAPHRRALDLRRAAHRR